MTLVMGALERWDGVDGSARVDVMSAGDASSDGETTSGGDGVSSDGHTTSDGDASSGGGIWIEGDTT